MPPNPIQKSAQAPSALAPIIVYTERSEANPLRFKPKVSIMRHPIIRHTAPASYDFSGIVNAIQEAKNNGKKRIMMRFEDFIVKPSKYEGKVYIYSHEKEVNQWGTLSNVYLGWITRDNTNLSELALIKKVQDAAKDPYAAAKLYGQNTGTCSCCGLELTNSLSIQLGIGPICREKFGL